MLLLLLLLLSTKIIKVA